MEGDREEYMIQKHVENMWKICDMWKICADMWKICAGGWVGGWVGRWKK